jgi:hypothetical protein
MNNGLNKNVKMKKTAFKLFESVYGNLFRFNSGDFFEWDTAQLENLNYLNSQNLDVRDREKKLSFLKLVKELNLKSELETAFNETKKIANAYSHSFKFNKKGDFICDEMYYLSPIFNKIAKLSS